MHPDGAVRGIVHHDHDHVRIMLYCRCKLLPVHQKIAITSYCDDRSLRKPQGGSDCSRNPVTHGAAGGRELRREPPVAPVTVPPAREIAGTVTNDRICGEGVAHELHGLTHVQRMAVGMRRSPFLPFGVGLHSGIEIDSLTIIPECRALGKLVHRGADCQIGWINAVKLVRIRVDMNQPAIAIDQRGYGIAIRRRFTEPRTDREYQIGVPDAFDKLRTGAVAEVSGINLT